MTSKLTRTRGKRRSAGKNSDADNIGKNPVDGDEEEEEDTNGNTNNGEDVHRKGKPTNSLDKKEDDRVWVQCNNCDKWRALPSTVDADSLPDIWSCELNIYDPLRNSCDAPEESFKLVDGQLKSFFKLWVKKLKSADRGESRFPGNASKTRKRPLEVEWIKCCNPICGKWRAIHKGIPTNMMLKKLNNDRWGSKRAVWYCSMNTWDDTTASCSAPQEPIFDCPWNLGLESS